MRHHYIYLWILTFVDGLWVGVDITYYEVTPLPFDLQGAFLLMCSGESLLDLENKECVVLSFIWAGSSSSLSFQLFHSPP